MLASESLSISAPKMPDQSPDHTQPTDVQLSPFLSKLPAELRLPLYNYVFQDLFSGLPDDAPKSLRDLLPQGPFSAERESYSREPAILKVCSFIRNEATKEYLKWLIAEEKDEQTVMRANVDSIPAMPHKMKDLIHDNFFDLVGPLATKKIKRVHAELWRMLRSGYQIQTEVLESVVSSSDGDVGLATVFSELCWWDKRECWSNQVRSLGSNYSSSFAAISWMHRRLALPPRSYANVDDSADRERVERRIRQRALRRKKDPNSKTTQKSDEGRAADLFSLVNRD